MRDVTRLPDIDAPARVPARAPMLLWAVVGLVAAALLLVVGLPREADMPAPASRAAVAFVQATMSGADRIHTPLRTVAPNVAEADEWVGRSSLADPLSHALPPPSDEPGPRPRGAVVVPAFASAPPDRPPRRA